MWMNAELSLVLLGEENSRKKGKEISSVCDLEAEADEGGIVRSCDAIQEE